MNWRNKNKHKQKAKTETKQETQVKEQEQPREAEVSEKQQGVEKKLTLTNNEQTIEISYDRNLNGKSSFSAKINLVEGIKNALDALQNGGIKDWHSAKVKFDGLKIKITADLDGNAVNVLELELDLAEAFFEAKG